MKDLVGSKKKHFYPYRSVIRTQHLFFISFVRPILNLPLSVLMFSDTACANISNFAAVQLGFLRPDVFILEAIF